jgi:hypothetical protein
MEFGPLTAEQVITDTNHLCSEGFIVIRVEGAEAESVWNFLFTTEQDAEFFERSIKEVEAICRAGRIENRTIESIAKNYSAVRYTFRSPVEAQDCRFTSPLK